MQTGMYRPPSSGVDARLSSRLALARLSRRGVNLTWRAAAPVYRNELCSRGFMRLAQLHAYANGIPRVLFSPSLSLFFSLPLPILLFFLNRAHTRAPALCVTLSRPRWRFYGVFCYVRCFSAVRYCIWGFIERLGRYLRHALAASADMAGYFCGMPKSM